jgi:hypothetical protein
LGTNGPDAERTSSALANGSSVFAVSANGSSVIVTAALLKIDQNTYPVPCDPG